jgi:hypothetical protein
MKWFPSASISIKLWHQTVGWAKQSVPIATMRFSQSTNLSYFALPNFALTITLPSLYPYCI